MLYGLKHGCKPPPSIPNRWPLGIDRLKQIWDADARGNLMEEINSFVDDYPTNMLSQFFLAGPRSYHSIAPENVEAILSSNFSDYSFGPRASVFGPLLGAGIFTQEGAAWKHSRGMLRKQLVRGQYQTMHQFHEHVDNLLARLPEVDGVVDLQPLFFEFTLDTASALLLGKSTYSLRQKTATVESRRNKAFADSFEVAQEGLARRFRMAPFHSLYQPKPFREACANIHQFIDDYVRETRSPKSQLEKEDCYGLVDQMSMSTFDDKAIRDQILNVLLAGRDTTAACLSWTFRLLARSPDVLTKLRAEIKTVIGNARRPTKDEIRRMPYLAQVIKESLRLYPPVPLNLREARKTTILPVGGGIDGQSPVLVRKGEVAVISQYVTARRKGIFGPDAAAFRPERWSDDADPNAARVKQAAYFPFNLGPRRCLGEDFALVEISYVLIAICQAFPVIEVVDEEKGQPLGAEKQKVGLVLCCMEGCKVRLSRGAAEKVDGNLEEA
ncbi:n-alkane-inducible cytochrome P450 [Podospora didyma]|uniref:N-alkane-inducible cytochrome P450 n=1 Tax=Podospora didyma TaxID=330526 RepID=A0AAE0KAL7_9PEZI|nr:n-alkane-inducible cytochrome P450 [Podospora didyma]